MRSFINFFIFILVFCFNIKSIAQISFSDKTDLLFDQKIYSGVAMGIIDMNGDGLDDIVRLDKATDLQVELQSQPNQKFVGVQGINTGTFGQWSICMADIDNNGTNEIMVGGSYNRVRLIEMKDGGNSFEEYFLPLSGSVFVQGSNFADIDNDGFVDVFTCNDDGESRIWENNGDGTFSAADHWIDMSFNGNSDEPASGNYGSTWVDVDNDGDIDLYIAKCRQGVFNVNDPRRINQLYINDGNGNFTEEASSRGLASSWQSWTADFQDINNDGWLDCFVTNHDYQAQLFLNEGEGYFSEIEMSGIEVQGLVIQGLMKDIDNDGWVDVITTGSKGQVFRNNGDLTFSEVDGLFDDYGMESLAIGDLNNDGYLDIFGGYANFFNNPSSINDKLWMNDGGGNNFLAVALTGVESNRNAIGARVEIYGQWGFQVREVRAGESYGIANSLISYFGLGVSESVDSIIVRWPSGLIQTEYDIKANSKVKIIEGECLGKSPDINISGAITFCSGDSVILTSVEEFDSYSWNNGSNEKSITVKTSGNFILEIIDENGCRGFSENISVIVDPLLQPEIVTNDVTEICVNQTITLMMTNVVVDDESITWSNGEEGKVIEVGQAGIYSATVTGVCNNVESNEIELFVYELPDAPEVMGTTIMPGEIATISATGDNLAWYENEVSQNVIGFGPILEIAGLESNTSYYVESRSGTGFNGKAGIKDHEGSLFSKSNGQNSGLKFDVFEAITLDSVKVYTDLPGERRIIVYNEEFVVIDSKIVYIDIGESRIHLGFHIPEGTDYRISTDGSYNFPITGDFGPRLQRSSININFPYTIEDIVSITGSNFGQGFYYYFYDWSISSGVYCASERTEVTVEVGPVGTNDSALDFSKIYPNPSNGNFTIQFSDEVSSDAKCTILDITGRILFQTHIPRSRILELELEVPSGMYILQIEDGKFEYRNKLIIE